MNYVNKNGKVFAPELISLAELSPAYYGPAISERNSKLLELLKAYEDDPDGLDMDPDVNLGCPHCSYSYRDSFNCKDCLWSKCYGADMFACCGVKFPSGYSYNDVSKVEDVITLRYSSDDCGIEFPYCMSGESDVTSQVANLRSFLNDHVDWGNLKIWGTSRDAARKLVNTYPTLRIGSDENVSACTQ